jgi:hypothetical protein
MPPAGNEVLIEQGEGEARMMPPAMASSPGGASPDDASAIQKASAHWLHRAPTHLSICPGSLTSALRRTASAGAHNPTTSAPLAAGPMIRRTASSASSISSSQRHRCHLGSASPGDYCVAADGFQHTLSAGLVQDSLHLQRTDKTCPRQGFQTTAIRTTKRSILKEGKVAQNAQLRCMLLCKHFDI